ncbi:CoA-acylating methylmalonate-semialdehyde dehydrogenase [Kocuria soli]|uniref:methylmalonate-semialdehyde dehydrogenase (CoA acylating) n=1 Tax=Kocuria soli TaxID=2485125 RepID=A0A3N3ZN18_9MICC|nr:CoA-acylating methylmalonate-semialdehyde dehydrogenase [Kocuria soli]ROZ62178.1 CoA-acylating methylmalonate-semialdehyde dehydrogenase [Kocuria soli]
MTRTLTHYSGGAHVKGTSGRFSDVYNPSTGEVQARLPLADADEVRAVVDTAAQAQPAWTATSPAKRARILSRFVDLVERDMEELAQLLSSEHGKMVPDSKGDIRRGLDVIEFAVGAPHLLKGEFSDSVGSSIDTYSMRQPLGVVAGITPFNFPAMIPLWKCGPAIAAGNAFVLKPSERDPSVPLKLAELWTEAGLPAGIFNVVNGDKEAVDTLLDDPRIKAVGFVGSTPIAQSIYERAAHNGKRAQCFGGAKNHMIVMPDADLDQVADALIGAAYGSAGERCMAISVAVPVGQETADALVATLTERTKSLKVSHSFDDDADYGPLVGPDALNRVTEYVGIGVEEGAELVVDGRGLTVEGHEGGYFLGPSLFDHVTPEMRIYKEEIFGPVLCVVRAADYEEALALPTDHQYGNGVSIFTQNGDAARDFASRVDVGMVGVNIPIPVPIGYYTFGGWKASGFGDLNQHGPDAFRFYTKTKTVTSRWTTPNAETVLAADRAKSSFHMPSGDQS